MTIPHARFHDDHLRSAGLNAPNGEVHVFLTCLTSDCSGRSWRVEMVAEDDGSILARGDVTCNGAEVLHELPMMNPDPLPLSMVQVRLRFTCGDGQPIPQPFPARIFLVRA